MQKTTKIGHAIKGVSKDTAINIGAKTQLTITWPSTCICSRVILGDYKRIISKSDILLSKTGAVKYFTKSTQINLFERQGVGFRKRKRAR